MNIDERIEALTQSVELLSQIHQDNEKRYERIFQNHDRFFERHEQLFERLVNIVESHENRITRIEEGNNQI